jgi:putative flippase GtrA
LQIIYLKDFKDIFLNLPAYVIIGILTGGVNIITFWLAINLMNSIYVATLIGNLTSILVNFNGLKQIFKAKVKIKVILKYTISLIGYYFFSVQFTLLAINLGMMEVLSRFLVMCLLFPFGYISSKYFVFR